MWDFSFKLEYTGDFTYCALPKTILVIKNIKYKIILVVRIDESSLYTIMTVENTDQKAFDFTALLHTYLHVDIETMRGN